MKSDLLASQFEALEEPAAAIVVDASLRPDEIVRLVLAQVIRPVDVRIFRDIDELSVQAATAAVRVMALAVRATGRCALALSGGHTPARFYELLASRFRDQISWPDVHVFWGDERYVAADDPDSNYRMARHLLLDHVPCPSANIHPMPTNAASPEAAASDYEQTLRNYFGTAPPSFDLNVLGIGEDGHTASLFAGTPALQERQRWVVATEVPAAPPLRLSLTLPVITSSASSYVLVAGAEKASALSRAVDGAPDPKTCPAAGLRLTKGELIWWVDRDAAAELRAG